jgi:hypothetical protein
MIQQHEITEGNLRAVKSTDDFGGPNMWSLYVKDANNIWRSIQWMSVGNIQRLFKTKLPIYKEISEKTKYEIA